MLEKKPRIEWIDCARGLGIILVVLGHSYPPFNGYIYSFHMPLFFILSGYTTSEKQKLDWAFLQKKVETLIIPFFSFSAILILLSGILCWIKPVKEALGLDGKVLVNWENLFLHLQTPSVAGATWFLIVLFSSSIFFVLTQGLLKRYAWLACWLSLAVASILFRRGIIFPFQLDLAIFAFVFVFIGHAGKVLGLESFLEKKSSFLVLLIAMTISYFSVSIHLVRMNWPTRSFDRFLLINVLAATAGSYICFFTAKVFISKVQILKTILIELGQKSIGILFFHFIYFKLFFLLLVLFRFEQMSYVQNIVPTDGSYWIQITVFSVICSYITTKVTMNAKILKRLLYGYR